MHVFLIFLRSTNSYHKFEFNIEFLNSMTENDNDSESKKSNLFSIADCTQLRNILIILYTMVETLRRDDENDTEEMTQARKEFLHDLGLLLFFFKVNLKS